MKTTDQLKPNYGPVYAAALYPDFAKLFHRHGYALAVHGSLARDFDLVAIPWGDALDEFRDCVLHERHEMAEEFTDSSQVNSVLDAFDRIVGPHLPSGLGLEAKERE